MSSKGVVKVVLLSIVTIPRSMMLAKRRGAASSAPEPLPEPEPAQQWPEQAPPQTPWPEQAPPVQQQPPAQQPPAQQPPPGFPEPPVPIEIPPFLPLPPLTLPEVLPWLGLPPIELFPTVPEVPTEPPKERAAPKTFKFKALHRYEVTVDALPVPGVSLRKLAEAVIPYMRMTDPDFSSTETVKRNGHDATRVRMQVSSLFDHEEPLERERSFAGVGSIWLVRAVDRGPY
jgi:hypothetical protein